MMQDRFRKPVAVLLGLAVGCIGLGVLVVLSTGYVLLVPGIAVGVPIAGLMLGLFFASPPPRSAALAWFAAGLGSALLVPIALSFLVLLIATWVPGGIAFFSSRTGPLVWIVDWGVAAASWRAGFRSLGLGLGVGALEIGLFLQYPP